MSLRTEGCDRNENHDEYFEKVRKHFDSQALLKSLSRPQTCVFGVPESLRAFQPAHYQPRMVGLGPYNHLRPNLQQEMENVKLDVTRRLLSGQIPQFKLLIDKLACLDGDVRACYSRQLDLNKHYLACIMAIDSAFLFYLLLYYSKDRRTLLPSLSLPHHEAVPVGSKLAESTILSDVMMLENQVPIFCMKEILTLTCGSNDNRDDHIDEDDGRIKSSEEVFHRMALRFCEFLSPIKCPTPDKSDVPALNDALYHKHLLGLLYCMIVRPETEELADPSLGHSQLLGKNLDADQHCFCKFICCFCELCKDNVARSAKFYKCCKDNMAKSNVKESMTTLCLSDRSNRPAGNEQNPNLSLQVIAEDTLLPSASRLADAGVKFAKTENIKDIRFKKIKARLYLPVIYVGVNTEVIIRNLVAYEATAVRNSLKFAAYVELMSGLIDTAEDVQLLKKSGILKSQMSDVAVATIFNTKMSIHLPGDKEIDRTIRDLNTFCEVSSKLWKLGNIFVYGFWRSLAFVLIIIYLLLVALQSVCSAIDCSGIK